MARLLIESPSRTYDVRTTPELHPSSSEVIDLIRFSEEIHQAVPVDSISFTKHEDVYKYVILTVDGRKWEQLVKFPNAPVQEASFTFDTPSFWRLSEFASQRNFRDLLVRLVPEAGLFFLSIIYNDTSPGQS